MGEPILNFRDLNVYKLAFELQHTVFELTKSFPREERYSLTDQIRRSSRSVGSNIAEAWQKRQYPAHFLSKLTDADGEQSETQHWVDTSAACCYISQAVQKDLNERYSKVGVMLGTMMAKHDKFCLWD